MKKLTIDELYAAFVRDNAIKQIASATVKYYNEMLAVFQAWLPKSIQWSTQLTRKIWDSYALYIATRIPNKTSQHTYLRAVRRFINFGAEIHACPVFKKVMPRTERKIKPTFSESDLRKLLAMRDCSKQACIAILLLSTGIRSASLRAIRVCDIDFSAKLLTLRHTKHGDQDILPLPDATLIKLSRYLRQADLADNALLFPTANGTPYDASGLYHLMQRYYKRIGLSRSGIHIMRHTFAANLARVGCPSITLSHYLTHSSVEQSEQYVALYGPELRDACDRFNPVVRLLHNPNIERTSHD